MVLSAEGFLRGGGLDQVALERREDDAGRDGSENNTGKYQKATYL